MDLSGRQVDITLDQSFDLKVGDVASLKTDETNFSFKLEAIEEDSRCPADVMCIWQGVFSARFICSSCSENKFYLGNNALPEHPTSIELNGFRIELLEIQPELYVDSKLNQNDYSLKLIVSRNE